MLKRKWIALLLAGFMIFGLSAAAFADEIPTDAPVEIGVPQENNEGSAAPLPVPVTTTQDEQPAVKPPQEIPQTQETQQPQQPQQTQVTQQPQQRNENDAPGDGEPVKIQLSVSCEAASVILGNTAALRASFRKLKEDVKPGGVVLFYDNGTLIGESPVLGAVSVIQWTPKTAGVHFITAQYAPLSDEVYSTVRASCKVRVLASEGQQSNEDIQSSPIDYRDGTGLTYSNQRPTEQEGEAQSTGRQPRRQDAPLDRLVSDMIQALKQDSDDVDVVPASDALEDGTGVPQDQDNNEQATRKNIATLAIAAEETAAYTGEPVAPALTIQDGEALLALGVDYTVDAHNSELGEAKATVSGIGGYEGSVVIEFTIVADAPEGDPGPTEDEPELEDEPPADSIQIAFQDPGELGETREGQVYYFYTGEPITPSFGVYAGEVQLAEGDYTMSLTDNVEAGEATLAVFGADAYDGLTATASFQIEAKVDTSAYTLMLVGDEFEYLGVPVEPDGIILLNGEPTDMVEGVDFVMSYEDNDEPGVATASAQLMAVGTSGPTLITPFALVLPAATTTTVNVTIANGVARITAKVALDTSAWSPGDSASAPKGSVSFSIDGGAFISRPLVNGVATYNVSVSTLGSGAHTVDATFVPVDVGVHVSSASAPFALSSVPFVTFKVSGGQDGRDAVLKVTVTDGNLPASAATGSISFLLNGTSVATITLSATGEATYTIPYANLPRGNNVFSAVFSDSTATYYGATSTVSVANGRPYGWGHASYRTTPSIDLSAKTSGSRVTMTATLDYGEWKPGTFSTGYGGVYIYPDGSGYTWTGYGAKAPAWYGNNYGSGFRPGAGQYYGNASGHSYRGWEGRRIRTFSEWKSWAGPPTGTVAFYNSNKLLGTAEIKDGKAVFTWKNAPVGTHQLRAVYQGNRYYTTASAAITYRVKSSSASSQPVRTQTAQTVVGDVRLRDANNTVIETYSAANLLMQDGVLTIQTNLDAEFYSYGFMASQLKELARNVSGHYTIITPSFMCFVPYDMIANVELTRLLKQAGVEEAQAEVRVSVQQIYDEALLAAYQAANADSTAQLSVYRVSIGLYDQTGLRLEVDMDKLSQPASLLLSANRLSGTAQRYDEQLGTFEAATLSFTDNYAILTVDQNGVFVVALDSF